MRLLISNTLLLCSIWAFAQNANIPQVPSSIEIVGMKLRITDDARREIQKDVDALRASDRYFKIKLDRVNLYFPIIERVFKEEGVPDDLKYLSVQESALISDIESTSDAVGYWQFKDFTAREVGLRVDNRIDERKNIVSASRGAARYLKRNNVFFSNWIYAVNAYMTGPGGAQKFVDRSNFGKDRMTIDKNTHWYVLRFIAHVIAFRDEIGDPHSQGLKLVEYNDATNKSLSQVANQFGVDEQSVHDYNKWLGQNKVPDDKIYTVIVPVTGKVPKIKLDGLVVAKTREPEQVVTKYPTVLTGEIIQQKAIQLQINGKNAVVAAPGDDLIKLSARLDMSANRLERLNDLENKKAIKAGQVYYTQRKRNRSSIRFHIAQYGETLWGISQKYGIKLKKLARKNRMEENEIVRPGRLLWLRKNRPSDVPIKYYDVPKPQPKPELKQVIAKEPEPKKQDPVVSTRQESDGASIPTSSGPITKVEPFKYHLVNEGETLLMIADFYDLTTDQIMKWNEMNSESDLSTGMNLRLKTPKEIQPIPREPVTAPAETVEKVEPEISEATYHEVVAGESLWGISKTYGVTVEQIQQWNNLTDGAISVGQKLKISEREASTPQPQKEEKTILIVKQGDTLYQIARKFDMTIEELIELNNLESTSLSIGQEIFIIKK